ncbi:MAG: hypothetical protein R6W73_05370 [Candidatus Saliniplasma sp.]
MSITKFEIKSIDAERFSSNSKGKKNVRIDHNSSVTKIKQITKDSFDIYFRFTANYKSLGRIELEGRLKIKDAPSDLASKWRKDNEMPNEIANTVHSAVIQNCIPKSVLIAREVQLPPPIPMPKVNVPKKGKKEKPQRGMEVA